MVAGGAHAHEHGASAVDVDAERLRSARRLGLALVLAGALLCAGGLWLFSLYQHIERVEPPDRSALDAHYLARVDAALAALDEAPHTGRAHAELARIYAAGGLFAEALAAYRIAARLEPDEPLWELHAARAELGLGRSVDARARLAQLCIRAPQHAAAHWWSGELARLAGDRVAAQAAFERCAELARERPEGHTSLARLALDARELELAGDELGLALEIDAGFVPAQRLQRAALGASDARALLDLQVTLQGLDFEWQDSWSEREIEFLPELEPRRARLRELIDEGRLERAIALCLAILEDHDRGPDALLDLARIRYLRGDQPGALGALDELLRVGGDSAALRELTAEIERARAEQDSGFSPPDR